MVNVVGKKPVGKVVSQDHPRIQKKIDKTLKMSCVQGSLASTFNSLNNSYITPFALAMKATASQVGIIGAIAMLFPALSQLWSVKLIEKYSRKKVMILGILLSTLIWVPIMASAMLFFNNVPYAVWILVALVGFFHLATGIIYPAWFSLMGSLVPEKERGKYFSKRNIYTQFFGTISMIGAAIFLDYMKKIGSVFGEAVAYTFLGFFTIFTLGMVIRLVSLYYAARHYEPRLRIAKKDHYTLFEFLKHIRSSPFGRFTLFNGVLRIGVGLAAPFIAVYLLKELGYSYTWYIGIMIALAMYQILFLKVMGSASDKFGNIFLTRLATIFITLTPLLWATTYFVPNGLLQKLYFILVVQLVAAIGWGALNLSMQNYVYDSSKQKRQGYAVAYMNLINGVGLFIGAMIGSYLVTFTYMSLNIIVVIFLLSFVLRAVTLLVGSRYLKEVRHVKKYTPGYFMHQFHPIRGTIALVHSFNHSKGRVIHHI